MDNSILQQILFHSEHKGDKIALKYKEEVVTYSQLALHIHTYALWLKCKGISSGDVVMMSGENNLEFIYTYFASNLIGAINVVVDGHSSEDRLNHIIKMTSPSLLIGSLRGDNVIKYTQINSELQISRVFPSSKSISIDDICDILFTTGTTGTPKGVCLTNANELSAAKNIIAFMGCRDTDVELLALPLCHSFGLGRLRLMLYLGATVVIVNGFANVKKLYELLDIEHATGFGMVPAAWSYLKKASGNRIGNFKEQLRYIEIGSASMPIEDKRLLCSLLPDTRICMHYGLTEASRSTFIEFHRDMLHLDSIGKSSPNVEVHCFSNTGAIITDNSEGELCVKGKHVMLRYLSNKDDEQAWYGDYFRTGDWGYEDLDGYLYLKGRGKEIINVGGKKLSPEEVENVILSMGLFADCACIAIPDPNGVLGEVVKCFAVTADGKQITLSELQSTLAGKLESFKIPAALEYIELIPKTGSGKKQRLLLKR